MFDGSRRRRLPYYNAIPLEMRKNLRSVVSVGRITNKREHASMADEVLHLSKDDMNDTGAARRQIANSLAAPGLRQTKLTLTST